MEMLFNPVLDPFPSRIDGEINGFSWGHEVNNGGRERAPFLFGHAGINRRRKRNVGEEEDGYKYPLSPNGHLSAAVPLFKCGSAVPCKTARVRVKYRLSWL